MARKPGSGVEARRSARVASRFLVAIEGIDRGLRARTGDLSATGTYFETTEDAGDVGTVHWLHLASSDGAREIHSMAHVVRKVVLSDAGGDVCGVALEFMPESDAAAKALADFTQYVLALVDDKGAPQMNSRLAARAEAAAAADAAVVRQLSVRSMTLETSFRVGVGERVRVDIAAPGMARRIRLEGCAVRISSGEGAHPPYQIEVEFQNEIDRPPRHGSSMTFPAVRPEALAKSRPEVDAEVSHALDDLFASLIRPSDVDTKPKPEHLSGSLARIRLPTLCALFDMERLSGELTLTRPSDSAIVYVKDGQLFDVSESTSPRDRIKQLLMWSEGSFEFDVRPVTRENRIGLGTTALLLDLARETDEATAANPERR